MRVVVKLRFVMGLALIAIGAAVLARGGGGGGGGHGGGGGGGGFGGGGFGGGYHGGRGYGGGNLDPKWTARLIGIASLVAGGYGVGALAKSRYRMVEVVVCLRNGEKYVPVLDDALRRADFSRPHDRMIALKRMGSMVEPDDVADGAVMVHGQGTSSTLGARVQEQYRMQMQRAGIKGDDEEVLPPAGTPQIRPGDSCVLGIVFTTRDAKSYEAGGPGHVAKALESMAVADIDPNSYLYIYYAPDPGQALDAAAAEQMTRKLAATPVDAPSVGGWMPAAIVALVLVTLGIAGSLFWYSMTLK